MKMPASRVQNRVQKDCAVRVVDVGDREESCRLNYHLFPHQVSDTSLKIPKVQSCEIFPSIHRRHRQVKIYNTYLVQPMQKMMEVNEDFGSFFQQGEWQANRTAQL